MLPRFWEFTAVALTDAFRGRPSDEQPLAALRAALRETSRVAPHNRGRIRAIARLCAHTPDVWARMVGDSVLSASVPHELARRMGQPSESLESAALATAALGAATAGWVAWLNSIGDDEPCEYAVAAFDALGLDLNR